MTTITEIVKQAKRDFDDRRAVKEQTFDDFVRWKDSICNKIDKLRQQLAEQGIDKTQKIGGMRFSDNYRLIDLSVDVNEEETTRRTLLSIHFEQTGNAGEIFQYKVYQYPENKVIATGSNIMPIPEGYKIYKVIANYLIEYLS